MALPDSQTLFRRYFDRWYSEEDRDRRGFPGTRPDVEHLTADAELDAAELSPLSLESQPDAAERVRDMLEAATVDWKALLRVQGQPSMAWVQAFDTHFHRSRVEQVLKRSDPAHDDNDYVVLCSELGSVLGAVMAGREPRLAWLYDWPYWESGLYDQQSQTRLNVFHWAIRRLSEDGVEDRLVDKVEASLTMVHRPL